MHSEVDLVLRGIAVLLATALLGIVIPAVARADSWEAGPASTQAHPEGVSVELPDGRVLVAGGDGTSEPAGELLSVGANAFTAARQMTQERYFAAAALLADGRVLIAGGDTKPSQSTTVPATAEAWSSGPGQGFVATAPMLVPRQDFTLTTLPDGEVLAVGGSPDFQSGAGSATAELFDPTTGEWTATGSMPAGRLGQTATLLPDCRVLIVGDNPTAVTYNYVTGTFAGAGAEGSFQRSYQTATLLADGRVLIAGGVNVEDEPLDTASVYDPATGTFTPTANNMSTPHAQGFAARLSDGRTIVGGGFSAPGTSTTAVDLYDPATNSWSSAAPLPSPPEPLAVSAEAQTLTDGRVAVMGIGPFGSSSEIYTPNPGGAALAPPPENCSDLSAAPGAGPGSGSNNGSGSSGGANGGSTGGANTGAGTGATTATESITFAVHSAKVSSGGTIRLTIAAHGAGRFTATAKSGKFVYGLHTIRVAGAGSFTLLITPARRARSLLAAGQTLHVTVTVAFAPSSAAAGSKHLIKLTVHGHRRHG